MTAPGVVLHMSEDRFLCRFVPMFPECFIKTRRVRATKAR